MKLEQAQKLLSEFFPNAVQDLRVNADSTRFVVTAKSRFNVNEAPIWMVSLGTAVRCNDPISWKVEVLVGGIADATEGTGSPLLIDNKPKIIRALLGKLREQVDGCCQIILKEAGR